MDNKHVLIIVYKFPPRGGVGSRRWAKFSKYLSRYGYKVHVLKGYYPRIDPASWVNDIQDNNIVVYDYYSKFPNFLTYYSKGVCASLLKRIFNFLLNKFFFYLDNCQYDQNEILSKAKTIIMQNNIKNVIASGHPVSINYISSYLKIDMPNINLIQDFRDNWNDDIPYIFPGGLNSFRQKEKSAYMEWFVINHSDYIVNVTSDITDRLKSKFKIYSDKFKTIYNGFDTDEAVVNIPYTRINDKKIKMIYAGSLGFGRINAINLIMDWLLKASECMLSSIEINIYTNFNVSLLEKKYHNLIIKKVINFFGFIPPDQILNIINSHDYCISINAPQYSYAFGTKIFDYMLLNKKIIHISNGGELFDLLKLNDQLVCGFNEYEIGELMEQVINGNAKNSKNNYDQFNLEFLTKQYIELFK